MLCQMVLEIVGRQTIRGQVDSVGDHRIAMAFSVAGLVPQEAIVIERLQMSQLHSRILLVWRKKVGFRLSVK